MHASRPITEGPDTALAPRHHLRRRLVLYFILLALIPLLVVMSFVLIQMQAQSEQQVINQLESVVELKQDQIDRWIDGNELVIESFMADTDRFTRLVDFVTSESPDPAEQAAINAMLRDLSLLHYGIDGSHYHMFFAYDRAGRIRAASDAAQLGKVVTNQPYFARSQEIAITQPPYYTEGNADPLMIISRPLRDQRGQVVGTLAGQVNLDALGGIMRERTGLGDGGETYLVSQENNYLLTPSRSPEYPLDRAYHSLGIDQALRGENGAGVYQDYRTPQGYVVGVYRWVPELNAALLAEIDEDQAMQPFAEAAWLGWALAALTALAALLVGFYVAGRISHPITTLAQVAARITAGALDQRAPIGGSDEIGVLAAAFNRMTARLQQTLDGLEQRVAERTAALEHANAEARDALADLRESLRERERLSATVRELSSPVLPVLDGILVMPLIGTIDANRAALLIESLLAGIEQHRSRVVIIDVTGVPIVDTHVAQTLLRSAEAAKLLGTQPILVGIRPEFAQTIVGLGLDLRSLVTCADLQQGISYALEWQHSARSGTPAVR
jgi:anti-anti-sigma regulatory factor/HAMP domain-containing protein